VLRIVWRARALRDLEGIVDFIEARNPPGAERLGSGIRYVAERLADHPYMHRAGRVPDTREAIVHPNHILI
jgi:toxin ParE1/3/4